MTESPRFTIAQYLILGCSSLAWLPLAEQFSMERIVMDTTEIENPIGVPIDLSYNETINRSSDLASASGCPKSIDGYPWVHYLHRLSPSNSELRCHLLGTSGPCPIFQVLYLKAGTMDSFCGCRCLLMEPSEVIKSHKIGISNKQKQLFKLCGNWYLRQVYDILDKSVCYNLWDQGPCENGTVVAAPVESKMTCLPVCDVNEDDVTTEYENKKCVRPISPSIGGYLPPQSCYYDDEKYSPALQKCVKQNAKRFVIG